MYDQANNLFIDDFDTRYYAYFNYFNVNSSGFEKSQNILFKKCSQKVLDGWNGYYASVGSANYLCFPQNTSWPLTIVNSQSVYSSVQMQVNYCVNNTNPTKGPVRSDCIPKADKVNLLQGKNIQMHYIIETPLIDTLNYTTQNKKSH